KALEGILQHRGSRTRNVSQRRERFGAERLTIARKHIMTKILVLYYSMYGHIEIMARAVAEGVRSANADVVIKRVPDTMSPELAKQNGAKLEQEAPFATPDELPQYDAIIFGTPTRFGNMAGQMRNFLDQTGSLWLKGALVGKVGSVFTSTGTGGGSQAQRIRTHCRLPDW